MDAMTLTARAEQPFSFHLSRYTQEELTAKRHRDELVPSAHAILYLDARKAGIGSNSCGPALDPAFQIREKNLHFTFWLKATERRKPHDAG